MKKLTIILASIALTSCGFVPTALEKVDSGVVQGYETAKSAAARLEEYRSVHNTDRVDQLIAILVNNQALTDKQDQAILDALENRKLSYEAFLTRLELIVNGE